MVRERISFLLRLGGGSPLRTGDGRLAAGRGLGAFAASGVEAPVVRAAGVLGVFLGGGRARGVECLGKGVRGVRERGCFGVPCALC